MTLVRTLPLAIALFAAFSADAAEVRPPKWRDARPLLLRDPLSRPHVHRSLGLNAGSIVAGAGGAALGGWSLFLVASQTPKVCLLEGVQRCFWEKGPATVIGVPALGMAALSAGLALGGARERWLAGAQYTGAMSLRVDPRRGEAGVNVAFAF